MSTYSDLPNKTVKAANGIEYAYRDAGEGAIPLVLLQHFRGNLDNWDPALVDALASGRRAVTFDNAGVGGSTGTTPATVTQMARDAIAFLTAMEFDRADSAHGFLFQHHAEFASDVDAFLAGAALTAAVPSLGP